MAQAQLNLALRHIRKLVSAGQGKDLTDAQLLQLFIKNRDESAFAALVERHRRVVWSVCRRVLRHQQDAEDAFQATFLVLARNATSVRSGRAIGSWLYQVAYRIAGRAGAAMAKRRAREKEAGQDAPGRSHCEVAWRELQAVLQEELDRLPEKHRAPFVLCCLNGQSGAEAARQLGWTENTVKARLHQARKIMQQRLARRGITLAAVLCATALAGPASATPAVLVRSTITKAVLCLENPAAPVLISARVAELMERASKTLFGMKAKLALLVLLAAGVFALGAVLRACQSLAQAPDQTKAMSGGGKPSGPALAEKKGSSPAPANPTKRVPDKDLTIRGRVLTPAGKAAVKARVAVLFWSHLRPQLGQRMPTPAVLAEGRVGGQGEFRLQVRRPAPLTYYQKRHYQLAVVAGAAGYGVGFRCVPLNADKPAVEIRLQTEQVRRGRLFNLQGQPAAGVGVEVVLVGTQAPEYHHFTQVDEDETLHIFSGAIRGRMVLWDQEIRLWEAPARSAAWPGPVTTDAQGRFTLRGIGPNQPVGLHFRARAGVAPQSAVLPARKEGRPPEVTFSLAAARLIEGTVTDAGTGAPLARAQVQVYPGGSGHPPWPTPSDWRGRRGLVGQGYAPQQLPVHHSPAVTGRTDARGRFRINPFLSDRYVLLVAPADRGPYLTVKKTLHWPRGAAKQTVAVALPRGVCLRGQVSETPSGKAVARARVDFWSRAMPFPKNFTEPPDGIFYPRPLKSDTRGEFCLVVPPGPFHLLINGPGPHYVFKKIPASDLGVKQPDDLVLSMSAGRRKGKKHYYYPDDLLSLNFKGGARPGPVKIKLRRAPLVRGRVVEPGGKPAAGAKVWLGQEPFAELADGFLARKYVLKDGGFELAVRNPDAPLCVAFLDAEKGLGAVAAFTARQAGKDPVTVRLAPCGSASARFVDAKGKPLAGYRPLLWLSLPARPYSSAAELESLGGKQGSYWWFNFDTVWAGNADPRRYGAGPKTDARGRITMPALIPGATYRVAKFDGTDVSFKAESGKTVKLGDLAIKDPEMTRELPIAKK
jgi:RNA polymerase sigma factor (sigma-70 family)